MKILILKKHKDVVEKTITVNGKRVFILVGKTALLADTGSNEGRIYVYRTKKERKKFLCKAHREIVEKRLK